MNEQMEGQTNSKHYAPTNFFEAGGIITDAGSNVHSWLTFVQGAQSTTFVL